MKKRLSLFLFSVLSFLGNAAFAQVQDISAGNWSVQFDESTKKMDLLKNGVVILNDVYVKFNNAGVNYATLDYSDCDITEEDVDDDGTGFTKKYVIHYYMKDAPEVDQVFYFHSSADYFLTEVLLKGNGEELSSNYIAPLSTDAENAFLEKSASNRLLTVPFDNDGFITYGSYPLSQSEYDVNSAGTTQGRDTISFEVTAIFTGETQKGLVLGSVEHDNWKSAIRMVGTKGMNANALARLELYSGATHSTTRDETEVNGSKYLMPHGALKGEEVKSAKMFVGFFDDWRIGLEQFGDANAAVVPKREWTKGTPYGWNSWGGMSTHVNYEGVISASDFVKENLQGKGGFGGPNNIVFVGLDSYWDNLTWEQLKKFADHCVENGQIPGVYWTPFNDWFPNNDRDIEGNNGYKYSQSHLKVKGVTKTLYGAGCMDPTAPATLSRINFIIDKFKSCGFKYIKLDFLTAGMVEADSWYNKDITTGAQAFNYGMKHLRERCGDEIFIVESIAPLFPYQYANARRISCDAWGEMWHTNYMMNSLSFGWWLNRVYAYNDPDHLVMGDRSEGENISRITTGAVTGYFMLGDNLSTKGNYVGTVESQEKVKKFAVNERVNAVVSLGQSFRPAYGHKVFGSNRAVDLFTLETEDAYYIAYFNYDTGEKTGELDLKELGFDPENISGGIECWTGSAVDIQSGKLQYHLLNQQAEIYHLYKANK